RARMARPPPNASSASSSVPCSTPSSNACPTSPVPPPNDPERHPLTNPRPPSTGQLDDHSLCEGDRLPAAVPVENRAKERPGHALFSTRLGPPLPYQVEGERAHLRGTVVNEFRRPEPFNDPRQGRMVRIPLPGAAGGQHHFRLHAREE